MMILPLCRRHATPAARGEAGPELALDARRIDRPSPESFPGAPRGAAPATGRLPGEPGKQAAAGARGPATAQREDL